MRGAFGKPQGTVARVRIGQPIMSVRSSDRWKAQVIEALRRAKFKFPGRQKVTILSLICNDLNSSITVRHNSH
jgi:large subunit ribosomal protein L10e